jgi:hypothetical protein
VLEKYDQIFDLSGIAKVGHKYYVISDKAHNTSLYQINLHKKSFQITDSISLQYDQNADIEAIDYCENFSWFFTNEQTNQAYVSDLKGHNKLLFDCKQLNSTFGWMCRPIISVSSRLSSSAKTTTSWRDEALPEAEGASPLYEKETGNRVPDPAQADRRKRVPAAQIILADRFMSASLPSS